MDALANKSSLGPIQGKDAWKQLDGTHLSTSAIATGGDTLIVCAGDWRQLQDDGSFKWNVEVFEVYPGLNLGFGDGMLGGMDIARHEGLFDWQSDKEENSGDWRFQITPCIRILLGTRRTAHEFGRRLEWVPKPWNTAMKPISASRQT